MSIDPDFSSKLKKDGEHSGHDVWDEVKPPERLGIQGTNVAVDHNLCTGESICVGVCPVNDRESWPSGIKQQSGPR